MSDHVTVTLQFIFSSYSPSRLHTLKLSTPAPTFHPFSSHSSPQPQALPSNVQSSTSTVSSEWFWLYLTRWNGGRWSSKFVTSQYNYELISVCVPQPSLMYTLLTGCQPNSTTDIRCVQGGRCIAASSSSPLSS